MSNYKIKLIGLKWTILNKSGDIIKNFATYYECRSIYDRYYK